MHFKHFYFSSFALLPPFIYTGGHHALCDYYKKYLSSIPMLLSHFNPCSIEKSGLFLNVFLYTDINFYFNPSIPFLKYLVLIFPLHLRKNSRLHVKLLLLPFEAYLTPFCHSITSLQASNRVLQVHHFRTLSNALS